MTVKILFIITFALVAKVSAMNTQTTYIPYSSPTDYELDSSLQYTLPSESSVYVQLKDSLNRSSKSLTNFIYNIQSLDDYNNFYQSNPFKYEDLYRKILKKFNEAKSMLEEDYTTFQTAIMNYYQQLPQNPRLYQFPLSNYDTIPSQIV